MLSDDQNGQEIEISKKRDSSFSPLFSIIMLEFHKRIRPMFSIRGVVFMIPCNPFDKKCLKKLPT